MLPMVSYYVLIIIASCIIKKIMSYKIDNLNSNIMHIKMNRNLGDIDTQNQQLII